MTRLMAAVSLHPSYQRPRETAGHLSCHAGHHQQRGSPPATAQHGGQREADAAVCIHVVPVVPPRQ